MNAIRETKLLFFIISYSLLLISCQNGKSSYISEEQREELKAAYDSLESTYEMVMTEYKTGSDTLPPELTSFYDHMLEMQGQMEINHRQMMGSRMRRAMEEGGMMKGMGMHMQGQMTGEWYSQMRGVHQQMAEWHSRSGQQSLADKHQRLSRMYRRMMEMIPRGAEQADIPFNEEADPSFLNGENLYVRNCASCHGGEGKGVGNVFPPLVNSEWITAEKSVPLRILLHGLSGEIKVDGQIYNGNMPSFKARLSAAEMASILNFLRAESEGDQPEITQEDVVRIWREHRSRTEPWSADELQGSSRR